MKTIQTEIAELIFDEKESILYMQTIEGANMNIENTKKHYEAIKKITGNNPYGALNDATIHLTIDAESLLYTSLPETIGKRIATAHYHAPLSVKMTLDFFKKNYNLPIPFESFKTKEAAVKWLKNELYQYKIGQQTNQLSL